MNLSTAINNELNMLTNKIYKYFQRYNQKLIKKWNK